MIATRRPGDYKAAVELLTDLRALAERDGSSDTFTKRVFEGTCERSGRF